MSFKNIFAAVALSIISQSSPLKAQDSEKVQNNFAVSAGRPKVNSDRIIANTSSGKDVDMQLQARMNMVQQIIKAVEKEGNNRAVDLTKQGRQLKMLKNTRDINAGIFDESAAIASEANAKLEAAGTEVKNSSFFNLGKRRKLSKAKDEAKFAQIFVESTQASLAQSQKEVDEVQNAIDEVAKIQKENIVSRMLEIPALIAAGKNEDAAANLKAVNEWVASLKNASKSEFVNALNDQLTQQARSLQLVSDKFTQMNKDLAAKDGAIASLSSQVNKANQDLATVTDKHNDQITMVAEALGLTTSMDGNLVKLSEDSLKALTDELKAIVVKYDEAESTFSEMAINIGATNNSPQGVKAAYGSALSAKDAEITKLKAEKREQNRKLMEFTRKLANEKDSEAAQEFYRSSQR